MASKIRWVNRLRISRGHGGLYKVRSPDKPYLVLKEEPTFEKAYRWAHRCRKFAKKEPPWSKDELEFLNDNYGLMPAETLAHRLGRTKNALKIISFRKLKIDQRSNLYTARAVAIELGIG